MNTQSNILEVNSLKIDLVTPQKAYPAVNGISFDIKEGEVFGLVGESGCGKSLCALTLAGLIRDPMKVHKSSSIVFEGKELTKLTPSQLRRLRGNRISMIFQEPMTALNPLMTVGDQIAEMFILHEKLDITAARKKAIKSLEQVQVPSPERRIHDYPHQLSGGMRQRVMIAIALACNPKLLIADEPTTALDVTLQAEVIDLVLRLCKERGTAVLMISHDLGLIARICNRVAVMYAGQIVEQRNANEIFVDPRHPYTQGLVASLPILGRRLRDGRSKLVEIQGIVPPLTERHSHCGFEPRCSKATDQCRGLSPEPTDVGNYGIVRCFNHD